MKVEMPAEEAMFIRERIERFPVEGSENLQWELPYVRLYEALPIYIGWTETVGIKTDGTLIRWSTENEWTGTRELQDTKLAIAALVAGADRYPALRRLLPSRPDGAQTCGACAGLGRFAQLPNMICECGGVGWVVV